MVQVTERIAAPDEEFEWTYARAGGPGGQNVNKVSSKAVLRWRLGPSAALAPHVKERMGRLFPSRFTTEGDLVLMSQKYRDQERNRQDCLEKLAAMVGKALEVPTPRKATKPSKGSKLRRLDEKKRQAARKQNRRAGGDE